MNKIDLESLAECLRKASDQCQKDTESVLPSVLTGSIEIALKVVAKAVEEELASKHPMP